MIRPIETIKEELRNLAEEGSTVELTKQEAQILEISNVYDELPESEVQHG